MELTELKELWKMDDHALQIELSKKVLRQSTLKKTNSMLGETKFESFFGIIVNGLFLLITGGYIGRHIGEPIALLPGVILHLIFIGGIIYSVYTLYLIYTMDYSASIIQAQKKMERLKLIYGYEIRSLYVLIPVMCACFLLIILRAWELYHLITLQSIIYVLGGSVIISIVMVWILKRIPSDIDQAKRFLDEIVDLESANKVH